MIHTPTQLIGLDSMLTDEERMIRDTVREFADKELRPHVDGWFEDHDIPPSAGQGQGGAHAGEAAADDDDVGRIRRSLSVGRGGLDTLPPVGRQLRVVA